VITSIETNKNEGADEREDSKEKFLEKLRVYVESIDTPNTGQDLNYLFQLVLSYK